ncbi:MAG: transglutaminase domain-containing protein, partial [Planctomycetota bacterium]
MQTSSRKVVEPILLAVISLIAVLLFRFNVEDRILFWSEVGSIIVLGTSLVLCRPSLQPIFAAAMIAAPPIFGCLSRSIGTPIAYELIALTTFGSASLAMALGGRTNRWRAMTLVTSGFLVLFCGAISDDQRVIVLPILWMLGCVWHLIANRWEWLDLTMPDSVSR